MDRQIREKIEKIVGSVESLPTLPNVASEVMELCFSSKPSLKDISKILANDPALASRVLKIANSAFYGLKQQVNSLELALVILGINEINHLVMSVSVFSTFPEIPGKETFDREKFWEHSAGCGHFARLIAKRLSCVNIAGEAFVGGLLHDIGKIVLDEFLHRQFSEVINMAHERNMSLYEVEKEILGFTHAEIGMLLAERWNLPVSLIEAIAYHHDPTNAPSSSFLVSIIRLADIFCKAKDIGFGGDKKGVVLTEDIAWQIIMKTKPELQTIDIEKFTLSLGDEIAKVREFIDIAKGRI